jgi:hypothetical protein
MDDIKITISESDFPKLNDAEVLIINDQKFIRRDQAIEVVTKFAEQQTSKLKKELAEATALLLGSVSKEQFATVLSENERLKSDLDKSKTIFSEILNNLLIGKTVRCIKDDKADDYYGIPMNKRWLIGDEMIVNSIRITAWGTFLHDDQNRNIDIRRIELV